MGPGDSLPSLRPLHDPTCPDWQHEGVTRVASGTYAQRYDRVAGAPSADHGDIGEDERGVWLRRHPEMLLVESPQLWGPLDRYRRGQVRLGRHVERLSAYEATCALIIHAAHQREVARRTEARRGRA